MHETTDELYLLRREIQELRKEISLLRSDVLRLTRNQRDLDRRTLGMKLIGGDTSIKNIRRKPL